MVRGAGDRRVNADLVAARGAGLTADLDQVRRPLLDRLGTDPGLRTAAGEVAAEMAAMPHPAELVPRLTALAGE
ncbi:nucleotide disphospho-sugar-binding domain-containing protein [Geodermatophilus sp. SYSU D01176]